MRLADLLAVSDGLEWTASGAERWLASAVVAVLGVLSISTQVVYLDRAVPLSAPALVVPAIPVFLSVIVMAAAVWLPRSGYGEFLPRVALWCFGGAVVFVAVGQLIVLSQRPLGTGFDAPVFVLAYMQTVGTAVGLVVGLYDAASERTKRELDEERDRAERYAQQLSVLNRVLRHDLRTGVQIIREYANMLPDPPEMEPTIPLDYIREQASKMYETAETARELQELMGTREQLIERVDVFEELDSAVDTVATAHPNAQIRVDTGESVSVRACRILDLAFEELVFNAVEHNDSDTCEVDIGSEVSPSSVVVRIADNGPGIPDAEIEPLRRGEETDLVHGSGVGLWLVNWIVDVSDGSLTFSENVSGGTTVTVRLPR